MLIVEHYTHLTLSNILHFTANHNYHCSFQSDNKQLLMMADKGEYLTKSLRN